MNIKIIMPWWIKIIVKLTLSKLPVSYKTWAKIGLFRHGEMDEVDYPLRIFKRHLNNAGKTLDDISGSIILELGPGDSMSTAVIASYYEAKAILIDAGNYATNEINIYNKVYEKLSLKQGGGKYSSVQDMLDQTKSRYMTEGVKSLRELPTNSVDFLFSQAVLEHVKLSEFQEIQKELFRILKNGAKASHRVDLKDHLGGGLNNLILPSRIWETNLFYESGFYTNRIRIEEMIEVFKLVGFDVEVIEKDIFEQIPLTAEKMAWPYNNYSIDQLNCSGFSVILTKPGA